jgi:hypothetical protein
VGTQYLKKPLWELDINRQIMLKYIHNRHMECWLDVIITTLFFSKVYIYHHFKISPFTKCKANSATQPQLIIFSSYDVRIILHQICVVDVVPCSKALAFVTKMRNINLHHLVPSNWKNGKRQLVLKKN